MDPVLVTFKRSQFQETSGGLNLCIAWGGAFDASPLKIGLRE